MLQAARQTVGVRLARCERGEMRVASDVAADNDSLRVPKHAARRPSQVTLAVTAWLSQYI